MPQDDDERLEAYWDDVQLAQVRQPPPGEEPAPTFRDRVGEGDLAIGTSKDRILVVIKPDGTLEYGPEYRPDEAAMVFWEAMGVRRLMLEDRLLVIQHMEGILVRLGVADLEAERLRGLAQNETDLEARPRRIFEANQAVERLERVVSQAIELGRGLARRPDIPRPAVPPQVPRSIQENHVSDYQGQAGLDEAIELPEGPARS